MGTGNNSVGHCTRRLPPTAPAATPATGHYAVSHVLLQYLKETQTTLSPPRSNSTPRYAARQLPKGSALQR
jgi:hypothetical protein